MNAPALSQPGVSLRSAICARLQHVLTGPLEATGKVVGDIDVT